MKKLANSRNFGPKYDILNQIGVGAWAAVYKARDKKTNQVVAVKIEPSSEMTLLKNEALKLMELRSSPYVPDLIDFFPNEVLFNGKEPELAISVLVMELLPCESFEKSEKIDDAQKAGMFRCLQSIHALGVVHADISLGNFVKCENLVKLLDFGSARHNENQQDPPGAEGTTEFTSAHVDTGKYAGFADDAEAVCFVIWRLVRGEPLPWALEQDDSTRHEMKSLKSLITHRMPKNLLITITKLRKLPHEMPDYDSICRQFDKDSVVESAREPQRLTNEKLFRIAPRLLHNLEDLPFLSKGDVAILKANKLNDSKQFSRYYDFDLKVGEQRGSLAAYVENGRKTLIGYMVGIGIKKSTAENFANVAASVWIV